MKRAQRRLRIYLLSVGMALSGCSDNIRRVDIASPPDKVIKSEALDLPLPKSAANMYYLMRVSGMQLFERYVRFEVAPEDLYPALQAVVAWHHKKHDLKTATPVNILDYEKISIQASARHLPGREVEPIKWWRLDAIGNGYLLKHSGGLMLWVDVERNIVYFLETD